MIYSYMGHGASSTTRDLGKLTDLQMDASHAAEIIIPDPETETINLPK